jgi:hypothetical protein
MDRLKLTLAGCGLAALLTSSGCRNLRSEVPPGRPFMSEPGQTQTPPVGFSSDPHPGLNPGGVAPATGMPGMPGMPSEPSSAQYGTPAPGATDNYGAPTSNAYGPPGTSALGSPPATGAAPAAAPAELPMPSEPAAPALPNSIGNGLPGASGP